MGESIGRHNVIRYYRHMSEKEDFDQFTAVLSRAIAEAQRLLPRLKVTPETKKYELFALIVLNELVRKCESVEAMAHASAYSGIDVVTRAAFENYADLLNLFKYKDAYPDYMVWASCNQQRSFLQPIIEEPTEFAKSYETDAKALFGQTPREMLAYMKQQMDAIEQTLPATFKDKNGKVQNRGKLRFELANKVNEYNVFYRHLSSPAHGRLSAMIEGIMHSDAIQWPPAELVTRPLVAIDSLCAILIDSCIFVAKKFNKPDAPLKKIAREHAVVRDTNN